MLPLEDIGAGASGEVLRRAMLFILFDVEVVFLYLGRPLKQLAVRLRGDAGVPGRARRGWWYVVAKGALDWPRRPPAPREEQQA